VLWLQVLASALALGVLGMFLAAHRPHRGLITIPDGPIVAVRHSMDAPPAALGSP
jgi:hypothetical protein